MNITAVIPSLNPDEKFLKVVDELVEAGFDNIILVNDGSSVANEHYFKTALKHKECTLLTHEKNLGKGRALKTAFNKFLLDDTDDIGVVTVDGDGQHLTKDIIKCVENFEENSDKLILGVRNFKLKNIPARSSFGNKLTSFAFKNLCGVDVSDTQTGLRVIPKRFLKEIIDLPGERFEYETNMLLETKNKGIKISEVPIETVYISENETSHFNPLLDSFVIYKTIGKFLFSSTSAMICDFLLFTFLHLLLKNLPLQINLFIAIFGARVVSSLLNFIVNKKIVFNSKENTQKTLIKYYILAVFQVSMSYLFVYLFTRYLGFNSIVAKVVVDFTLFLLSFNIQLKWVFAE